MGDVVELNTETHEVMVCSECGETDFKLLADGFPVCSCGTWLPILLCPMPMWMQEAIEAHNDGS